MKRTSHQPPSLATAMLRLLEDPKMREAITGDLIEEFGMGGRSNLWYWRQVMQTLSHFAARSIGRTLGALAAGVTLVAAVSLVVTAEVRILLPVMATRSQPIRFAFTFMVLALVLASTMVAGFLTARLVRQAETRVALWLGVILLVSALWWLRLGAPSWFVGLVFVLTIPAAWAGGRLRVRHKARA